MRLSEILKSAADMGIDPMDAVSRRISYLALRYFDLRAEQGEDMEFESNDLTEQRIFLESIVAIENELATIRKEQRELKDWVRRSQEKPAISDDDIVLAKEASIESVVEFIRGKVTCPFHDDKNPSAYHGTRTNRLVCPVCNKTWSAIDVLIKRDGYSFIDAVKHLIGR